MFLFALLQNYNITSETTNYRLIQPTICWVWVATFKVVLIGRGKSLSSWCCVTKRRSLKNNNTNNHLNQFINNYWARICCCFNFFFFLWKYHSQVTSDHIVLPLAICFSYSNNNRCHAFSKLKFCFFFPPNFSYSFLRLTFHYLGWRCAT